jgi:hypothetical protein
LWSCFPAKSSRVVSVDLRSAGAHDLSITVRAGDPEGTAAEVVCPVRLSWWRGGAVPDGLKGTVNDLATRNHQLRVAGACEVVI